MPDVVLDERRDAVAVITLNRPDRLNAWTQEMGTQYLDALANADADPQVRAIVLTGAGRGFCAGADFETIEELIAEGGRFRDPRPMHAALDIDKPLIAAVNGACAGLGLVQAMFCDVRFIAADAKITTAFARRGLIAEYGLSWILTRTIGHARASDLLLSGRVLSGREAVDIGLGHFVADAGDVLDQALTYAADLATFCSPRAMATIKHQLRQDATRSFTDAAEAAETLMREFLGGPDVHEGVASAREKRAPSFAALRRT